MTGLVLDTCTERMIVGVRTTGTTEDRWINLDAQGNHARDLLAAIDRILAGTTPDVIGVALGPGSFTGVRIALATAKGLAEGWGCPLTGLDNLAAMADAWSRLHPQSDAAVLPVIDARKKKFYGALVHQKQTLIEAADRSAADWLSLTREAWTGPVVLSGYQGQVMAESLGSSLPDSWSVLPLRDWTPGLLDQMIRGWENQTFLPPEAGPRYLRLSEAEENRQP